MVDSSAGNDPRREPPIDLGFFSLPQEVQDAVNEHAAARYGIERAGQDDPTPESSLAPTEIYRVVCDQHVNGHGVPGGWYDHPENAQRSIDKWWKAKYPNCTGWRIEIRRITPWEAFDA